MLRILTITFGIIVLGVGLRAGVADAQTERATAAVHSQVRTTQASLQAAVQRSGALSLRYEKQLREVDRLKRKRASWRRDSQLATQLKSSQLTAKSLEALDRRIRVLRKQLRARQRQLLAAVDAELTAGPTALRRARLTSLRARTVRVIRRVARKIVLPNDTIDPLADPEDLLEQAELLRRAEKQLQRELKQLGKRSQQYRRMARLRSARRRAKELRSVDDEARTRSGATASGDRGSPGRGAGPNALESDDATAGFDGSPDPGGVPPTGAGGVATDRSATILEDVVDAPTLGALRRASVSRDPKLKAHAAERASGQVRARLNRLRQRRAQMEKRARKLRRRR